MSPIRRRQIASATLAKRRQPASAHLKDELGSGYIAMVFAPKLDTQPVMSYRGLIAQQCDRLIQVADHQIRQAIVIEIADGQPAANMLATEV